MRACRGWLRQQIKTVMATRKSALPHVSSEYDPYGNIRFPETTAEENVDSETERASRFGGRRLLDQKDRYLHNAWDHIEWTEEQKAAALARVAEQVNRELNPDEERILHHNEEAAAYWNAFYEKHESKFFKERSWLPIEFPELFQDHGDAPQTFVELGSGPGASIFPILQANANPNLTLYALDFSPCALSLIEQHPQFDPSRCRTLQHDLTQPIPLPDDSVDIFLATFVLSAIAPHQFPETLRSIYRALKPGGLLLFRDYGRHDMTQLRFKPTRRLGDDFYVRGDGTQVFFFDHNELASLAKEIGFSILQNAVDRRLLLNRAKQKEMYRIWLQCKYQKPLWGWDQWGIRRHSIRR